MKEFDLAKAKSGAPVCTRDGKPARIICWDANNPDYPIVALVGGDDIEDVEIYTDDGFWLRDKVNDGKDLVMAPVKHEGWVIIDKGSCFSEIHESKEKAMEFAEREEYDYTAIAHIEWEE